MDYIKVSKLIRKEITESNHVLLNFNGNDISSNFDNEYINLAGNAKYKEEITFDAKNVNSIHGNNNHNNKNGDKENIHFNNYIGLNFDGKKDNQNNNTNNINLMEDISRMGYTNIVPFKINNNIIIPNHVIDLMEKIKLAKDIVHKLSNLDKNDINDKKKINMIHKIDKVKDIDLLIRNNTKHKNNKIKEIIEMN